jgi:probable rRNA maturation factor
MIDVDVVGLPAAREQRPDVPRAGGVRELCLAAAASAGLEDGHLAVEFVDATRIAELNREHRGVPQPTDVLSFPIDGAEGGVEEPSGSPDGARTSGAPPDGTAARARARARGRARRRLHNIVPERELGDVVICIEHTSDVREAIVHGVLHLAGMDHERDNGEMLALQREVLAEARIDPR